MTSIQLCGRRYRIYTPSLEVWPAARWVLVQDDGLQVQFRSHGEVPTVENDVNEKPRSWSFDEAIVFVHVHPDDEIARLLLTQLVYFYFLEPLQSTSTLPESD